MRAGKLLLPVLTVAFGVYLLWSGVAQIMSSIQSATWPSAPGEVLASRVAVSRSYQASSSSRNPVHHRAEVRYAYVVGGRRFTNDRIAWRDQSTSGDDASLLVTRYAKGTKVQVFYDPDEPHRAILEKHVPWSALLRLTFGALFSVAGILLFRFVQRVL